MFDGTVYRLRRAGAASIDVARSESNFGFEWERYPAIQANPSVEPYGNRSEKGLVSSGRPV